jgi:hypothetical protein
MRFATSLGLVCALALAASVSAQPNPPAATTPYPIALYQMNDISKSLNLTAEQISNLNKLTEQTQAKYRDDYAKLSALKEAERFNRMQELNRQYYADWTKGAGSVFNDTQRTRYQQLGYQYGGFGTFYDPDVQKRLNLTADQQKALRDQWDWSNQQLQEIYRTGATDATKGTQMYNDYWKARQARLDKFLTADQQKAWRDLTGDPYTFQPTFTPRR